MSKVALVTGALGGLGTAISQALAKEGYKVVAAYHPEFDKKEEWLAEQEAAGFKDFVLVPGDVSDYESAKAMIAEAEAKAGPIDILVNNAGILRDGLLLKIKDGEISKMSLAQWQAVIDVNLTGVFLCTREVAAKMVELKSEGAIINISSISRAGNMGQTNYSAAKAGVASATVVWAKELARYGIRVAGVAPGFIETEMVASMKPEALDKMTSGIPLKRMGKPAEIAHSVAYIFENDYYTGRILELDGGLRL